MFGPSVDVSMPNIVDDVCVGLLRVDSVSGARRAPVGLTLLNLYDFRVRHQDDRRHPSGLPSRSAGPCSMPPAAGGFAVTGFGPGPAPMSFPYFAG